MIKEILIITALSVPYLSFAQDLDDPFPPTGLERIEKQMDKIADSVHQIDKNVAVGQRDISTFADAFSEQKEQTSLLKGRTLSIENDLVAVKIDTKGNKEDIRTIKGNLFKIVLSILTMIGMIAAAYITRKNHNQKDKT